MTTLPSTKAHRDKLRDAIERHALILTEDTSLPFGTAIASRHGMYRVPRQPQTCSLAIREAIVRRMIDRARFALRYASQVYAENRYLKYLLPT